MSLGQQCQSITDTIVQLLYRLHFCSDSFIAIRFVHAGGVP
jgi:hypothetical protein